jgi:hypothetical protein
MRNSKSRHSEKIAMDKGILVGFVLMALSGFLVGLSVGLLL